MPAAASHSRRAGRNPDHRALGQACVARIADGARRGFGKYPRDPPGALATGAAHLAGNGMPPTR